VNEQYPDLDVACIDFAVDECDNAPLGILS
jgi:hypothetical protein